MNSIDEYILDRIAQPLADWIASIGMRPSLIARALCIIFPIYMVWNVCHEPHLEFAVVINLIWMWIWVITNRTCQVFARYEQRNRGPYPAMNPQRVMRRWCRVLDLLAMVLMVLPPMSYMLTLLWLVMSIIDYICSTSAQMPIKRTARETIPDGVALQRLR